MPHYYIFQAIISTPSEKISVPTILSGLTAFLKKQTFKNQYFPVFNEASRKSSSHKQILYIINPLATGIGNFYHGYALALEPSSITVEKADYADNEFLTNLNAEIVSLLICILFLSKALPGSFSLSVSIQLESNNRVFLPAQDSMVVRSMFTNYILTSPYHFIESITDIQTSTLADFFQNMVHAFMAQEPDRFNDSLFLQIDREKTEWHINRLKTEMGVDDISVY